MLILNRVQDGFRFASSDAQAIGDTFQPQTRSDFEKALLAFRHTLHPLDRDIPLSQASESFIRAFPT